MLTLISLAARRLLVVVFTLSSFVVLLRAAISSHVLLPPQLMEGDWLLISARLARPSSSLESDGPLQSNFTRTFSFYYSPGDVGVRH